MNVAAAGPWRAGPTRPWLSAGLALLALISACGGNSSAPSVVAGPPTVPTACAATEPRPAGTDYLAAPVAATASSTGTANQPADVYGYGMAVPHWISAGAAPQWILLDLGWPRAVTEIRLCVIQASAGATSHRILGGRTPTSLAALADINSATENGQLLSATLPPDPQQLVRYLKIETSSSPSVVAWGRIEVWGVASHRPFYFGYYGDAFTWLTNVTAEVAGYVNVSWVSSDLAGLNGLLGNLDQARNRGLKTAVAIPADVFFSADLTLAPEYEANWRRFADAIRPHIDNVAFLYPIDEPYSQAKIVGMPAADMKARLELVGSIVKQSFPAVPTAFTFSAIDFDTQDSAFANLENPLPAHYDWFGFDCYGSWERCGEPDFRSVHAIPWYLERIKQKLSADQRVFLFADTFVRQAVPGNPAADAEQAQLRLRMAEQFNQLALSDTSLVGLFGFLYQDDYVEGSQRFLGAKHWPALRDRYETMGLFITGK